MQKLISSHELQKRSESELSALFCTVSKGLVRTKRGSPERRNSLASLENISRARTARMQKCTVIASLLPVPVRAGRPRPASLQFIFFLAGRLNLFGIGLLRLCRLFGGRFRGKVSDLFESALQVTLRRTGCIGRAIERCGRFQSSGISAARFLRLL